MSEQVNEYEQTAAIEREYVRRDDAVAAEPTRETEVGQELRRLPDALDDAHQCIAELEARLAVVLRQEQELAEKVLSEPRVAMVPLAEDLAKANDTARAISRRLRSCMDRLEL